MLSHVIPAARISFSVFRVLNFVIGAASFTPILFYSIYLYRLSFCDFIPTLPRRLQPYLEILIPILLVIAIVINGVSSFVGIHLGTAPNQLVVVQFAYDSKSLWFSLSRSSLAIYALIQFTFFLLTFSRFSRAFLEQRRIELTHSDEYHYFNGITWITVGVVIGVAETIPGFTRVTFCAVLARRILRLVARAILMFGLLKGLDVTDNFENLTDELRGPSRISGRISHMLGIKNTFRRISHSNSEASRVDEYPTAGKQRRDQRVTVHYEKGQAPLLQIRFSAFDLPAQDALADMVRRRRRSLSGLIPGNASAGSDQHGGKDVSDEMAAARNVLETPRAESALVTTSNNHHVPSDWIRPPEKIHTRQGSGGTVSDTLSIIRDLERNFPNLPPRVTGKYRGSILGQNYEEDPFPVVGVSRQPSLRGGANNPSEEGRASVTLSASGSIKRKPAPPLLENISYISDPRKRLPSSWGGLTRPAEYPIDFPNSPSTGATVHSPDSTLAREPSTPRSRRMTALDVFKRASRALSDASIRSAEWLASANTPRSARTPFTTADIEMYRRLGPGSVRLIGEASSPENLPKPSRRSADDARTNSKPSQPRRSVGI
ncbi:hypothetical protein JVT61DRAFT_8297 [Boletus reticuloceps]|uniref:Uncharacterized protein n=1 Tax=Boletus reticuloceps TaxID=495285 RepID=A0A8I3ACD6_9AGAM|nr:hypothetical protein JVT61DRAFT_8297 [Boletus reticuloceps]